MKIDLNNYEEWAIDYIDGSIPSDIKSSFDLFLAQNPDIKSNIDSLSEQMPTLKSSTIIYPDKDNLIRGGKTLTLKACIHYLSGAAVAAVIMFGFFMITQQRADSTVLVTEAAGSIEVINKVKQSETTPTATTEQNKLQDATDMAEVVTQEVLIAQSTPKAESELNDRILLSSTDFEAIGGQYNVVKGSIDLSIPTTLAYISDIEMTHARTEESFSGNLRQALASIIAPIDRLSPIKTYKTQTGHGIEIASRYRIGR